MMQNILDIGSLRRLPTWPEVPMEGSHRQAPTLLPQRASCDAFSCLAMTAAEKRRPNRRRPI